MKTFFRVSMLGLLMVAFTTFTSIAVTAQTPEEQKEKNALYNCFLDNYDKFTLPQQKKALDCAEKFTAKFPNDQTYVDYFKGEIPVIRKWIKDEEDKIAAIALRKKLAVEKAARLTRITNSYKKAAENVTVENWQEAFDAGESVIRKDKEHSLDAKILLAESGFYYLVASKTPIDAFNNKILEKANSVIADINSGKQSKNYGVFDAQLKTKEKALARMNEIIGYIKVERQKKGLEGVGNYYAATKYVKDWNTYRRIGAWYRKQAAGIGKKRTALDQTDEANLPQIKEYLAMERGYASRAIDAYARAYSIAKSDPEVTAKVKTALYDSLKLLFNYRYSQPVEKGLKTEASIQSYVASVGAKTMPNPTTKVEPIPLQQPKEESETTVETKSDAKDDAKQPAVKSGSKTSMKNGATRSRRVQKAKSGN